MKISKWNNDKLITDIKMLHNIVMKKYKIKQKYATSEFRHHRIIIHVMKNFNFEIWKFWNYI